MTSTANHEEDLPTLSIRHQLRKWVPIYLHELWAYRELLFFFTWKDVKIQYKQTSLGFTRVVFLLLTIATPTRGGGVRLSALNPVGAPWDDIAECDDPRSQSLGRGATDVRLFYFKKVEQYFANLV